LIDMRDNVLVETQAQLDELAAGLATAMSNIYVAGSDVTSGAASGQDINLDNLQSGNSITVTYTEGGEEKTVTIVRVDDASSLPLDDDQTALAGDTVIGIDFSSGYASAAADINAALSPGVVVSALSDGLRFLDDGATGNSDISSVTSTQTATSLQSGESAVPLFLDGDAQLDYTGSLDGEDQKVGFAGRITINDSLEANNELLVLYDTTTETGDTTRPSDLLARLNETELLFSASAGIGTSTSPYGGTIMEYGVLVVSDQTGNADAASAALAAQETVLAAVQSQLAEETGVSIDEELTKLIEMQNSYAANARILQAIDEMYQTLLSM
jgi:flagellar hook-associated protein 1 FlgK